VTKDFYGGDKGVDHSSTLPESILYEIILSKRSERSEGGSSDFSKGLE